LNAKLNVAGGETKGGTVEKKGEREKILSLQREGELIERGKKKKGISLREEIKKNGRGGHKTERRKRESQNPAALESVSQSVKENPFSQKTKGCRLNKSKGVSTGAKGPKEKEGGRSGVTKTNVRERNRSRFPRPINSHEEKKNGTWGEVVI